MTLPEPALTTRPSRRARIWDYFIEDVREDILLESELILLSFATGIQDAAAWPDFSCFASNQTGNTLLLAIGVAGLGGDTFDFRNIGISLGAFLAGGLIMGQIGNFVGVRKRLWLLTTNLIQTAMIFAASAIQYALGVHKTGPSALGVIFLMAFSSGGQVAMARSLRITEITTAMATSAYADAVVDPQLLALRNRKRDRRVLFVIMLTAGCFAGAFAQRNVNSMFTIVLCGVGKAIVTLAFFFNRPMEREGKG
ncbi:hypothetical protein ASPSYDRAFT_164697 [Aspergillus sydowii CBS 593.65]|uniref:DUF1275 domain protein n=1 Tax=Aspergillus sydowii CBS 593.65 TaxID=1036612 RepID=A0A1L9SZ17_9EURO|nr:uncharacterized protein ASPSYDRAFT_164697 [Aspergillus sydowii CBS 593.65]OJJ52440.1 hypothetical protein ASPSYDRAFT_164697 [Aspergillus sydowii CBS 593.65]